MLVDCSTCWLFLAGLTGSCETMSEYKLLCPILSADPSQSSYSDCVAECCAWWDISHCRCAVIGAVVNLCILIEDALKDENVDQS